MIPFSQTPRGSGAFSLCTIHQAGRLLDTDWVGRLGFTHLEIGIVEAGGDVASPQRRYVCPASQRLLPSTEGGEGKESKGTECERGWFGHRHNRCIENCCNEL